MWYGRAAWPAGKWVQQAGQQHPPSCPLGPASASRGPVSCCELAMTVLFTFLSTGWWRMWGGGSEPWWILVQAAPGSRPTDVVSAAASRLAAALLLQTGCARVRGAAGPGRQRSGAGLARLVGDREGASGCRSSGSGLPCTSATDCERAVNVCVQYGRRQRKQLAWPLAAGTGPRLQAARTQPSTRQSTGT